MCAEAASLSMLERHIPTAQDAKIIHRSLVEGSVGRLAYRSSRVLCRFFTGVDK
jgi:hypothetical protein